MDKKLLLSGAIMMANCATFSQEIVPLNQNLTTDEFSLLESGSQITSDPFAILANWFSTIDICKWAGVYYNLRKRIMALDLKSCISQQDLSGWNLGGTISPQLGNLTFRTSLDISSNFFSGFIPNELANLQGLKQMNFGHNNFSGVIPSWLGALPELELLLLDHNRFTGVIPGPWYILDSILLCNKCILNSSILNKLSYLSFTVCTGGIPLEIGSFLLNMWYNLPALEELYLSTNQLNGPIPSFIWDCKTLVRLYLAENNFTGEFPGEIGKNNILEILSVINNNLSSLIQPGIFNMSSLVYMHLAFNYFSGSVPSASSMQIRLPKLQEIFLNSNKFSGRLPSPMANYSKFTMLVMSQNSFTGPIPSTLGNVRSLKYLFLGDNNLTRESSTPELRFISSLTNCRQLEYVVVSGNQFDGLLPASIGNFSSSLRLFTAFGSRISGTIPSENGNLSSLEAIYFDNNDLTGYIPSSVGNLSRVQGIYLEHNRLQGHIPTELCQPKNLGDL
nr:receptor kinase-like protein Xa21 [Coffea arabica]